jgi:RHS repeat-associated protein
LEAIPQKAILSTAAHFKSAAGGSTSVEKRLSEQGDLDPVAIIKRVNTRFVTGGAGTITVPAGDTVTFSGLSSYDRDEGGSYIYHYSWSVQGGTGTGSVDAPSFSHQFTLGGDSVKAVRTVELTVVDDEYSSDTVTQTVRVVRPERRYYVKDHLGSVRVVMDDSANVEETRDYYPFGLRMPGRVQQESPQETEEDFTGHVKDNSTQLHYAGARYYSSAFGRWTTTEPLLQSKSPKKLLKNKPRILTRSVYGYTFNNPINLKDPDGNAPCCLLPLGIEDVALTASAMAGNKKAQKKVKQRAAARASTLALALPGPEDAVLAVAGATKVGRAVSRFGDEAAGFVRGLFKGGDEAVSGAKRTFDAQGSGTELIRTTDLGDGTTVQVKSGHGFNRAHESGDLRDSGLTMDETDGAIVDHLESSVDVDNLPTPGSGSFSGAAERTITVNGTEVTYRAVKLKDGRVSVGTYFPAK